MAILAELTFDEVLDTAYGWLCRQRRDYSSDAYVWSFRQAWVQEKDKLKAALAAGRFHFGLLTRVTLKDGEEKATREVCLDGEKNDRMTFQARADYQNHAIGWLQRGYSSLGGGTVVRLPRIRM